MTVWPLGGKESLLTVIGKSIAKHVKPNATKAKVFLALLVRLALCIAGLALISAGAFVVALPLGLCVAGVSCLILEWVVKR